MVVPDHDLLFVGNMSYVPNIDAVTWLCRQVLPRLSGVTTAIVGRQPPPEVRALASERVTVAADVADVTPWYSRTRIAVAPLFSGGGTRIKVLEAFAHQRPVVATTIGAEGLGLSGDGGPILVADEPSAFAAACRRLLGDPGMADDLARRGHEMVARLATIEVVAATIDRLFCSIAAQPGHPGRAAWSNQEPG
jgi:glycosyltransferase involved in cell wall biosynthesis